VAISRLKASIRRRLSKDGERPQWAANPVTLPRPAPAAPLPRTFSRMFRFAVLDGSGPVQSFPLRRAHLLGPDGLIVPGAVRFEKGHVAVESRSRGATALALLWDDPENGSMLLDTCLLPDREAPYLLSLELARKRIMLFLVKLEEWGLTDLPSDHPAMSALAEARASFTEALCRSPTATGEFGPEQDRLARSAISSALRASERLTETHAERSIAQRLEPTESGDASAGLHIGCVIDPTHFAEPLQRLVSETFDFVKMPMRWSGFEPEEGRYQFSKTDRWIEWAVRKAKLPIAGGPLLDLSPQAAPDWLYIWENDYETLREVVYEHLKRVVTRYRRTVTSWTVVSGLHVNANFTLELDQIIDLTRLAVLLVRKLQPNARIEVEVAQPFGEYVFENQQSLSPLLYLELLFQAGVGMDAIGVRVEMGEAQPGTATRDLIQMADLLDRIGEFEKPISISALAAPSQPPKAESLGSEGAFDPGHWRDAWSESTQASWLTHACSVAFANPHVSSVCWHGLYDLEGEDVHTGLITASGKAKSALARIRTIHERLRQMKPFADLVTNGAGSAAT